LPGMNRIFHDVHTLMDNVQAFSNKVRVEYLSPQRDVDRLREIKKDYDLTEIEEGILIAYGRRPASDKPPPTAFIEWRKMYDEERPRPGEERNQKDPKARTLLFKGEEVFTSELSFLTGGKKRPRIYFTQANQEPSLREAG